MDNSLAKLLECVEPKIANIQEARIEIKSLSEVCKTITEIVELGKKSYLEVLEYYDQEFIIRCIKLKGQNVKDMISKYKTCRYLLQNQDTSILELPQYKESLAFMDSLYAYLNELAGKFMAEYEEKADILRQQELLNKYYILLQKENVFIPNAQEFLKFLDYLKPEALDRLNILIYVNRCNIKNYNKKEEAENIFISNVNLTDIKNLLERNALLIDNDTSDTIEPIINLGKKNNEAIAKKKHCLINKIKEAFDSFEYDEAARLYKEYETLNDYETEFLNQELCMAMPSDKKMLFLRNQDKSVLREYLEVCKPEYQGPIQKNLLDIEKEKDLLIPDFCFEGTYIYVKPEFIVKTVYTFLDNGYVLILGAYDKRNSNLLNFLNSKKELIEEALHNQNKLTFDNTERDLILKNIKEEDLVLTINLNMLDVKMEEENAR